MKNDLPKIYANKIDKKINNSQDIYYENHSTRSILKDTRSIEKKVNDIFNSSNFIYKSRVKITMNNTIYNKIIVGKTGNNLLTMDNEIININDIQDIEVI